MNIQIFGVKDSFDTKKSERYFKERRIKYQYVDLGRFGISKGELQSVKNAVGSENLADYEGKEYKSGLFKYINNGVVTEEMLLENPRLIKLPIVRNGRKATVGYRPDVWKDWE